MSNPTETMGATMIEGGTNTVPPSGQRKRGRPPGSKNRPKDGSGNPIPETPSNPLLAPFVYVADDTSIAASTAMGGVVWAIIAPMFKMRDLKDDEREKLGRCLDPVLCRWIPILGEWKYEAALLMAILGLARTCKREYQPPQPKVEANGTDHQA